MDEKLQNWVQWMKIGDDFLGPNCFDPKLTRHLPSFRELVPV